MLHDAQGLESLRELARGVPIESRTRTELDRLAGGTAHQGVVLEAGPLPLWGTSDLLGRALPADAVILVLDGIEDPHNFGAMVRSACACGALAVLFAKDRSAPISPAMLKAAAGAAEHIPLVRVTNLVRAMEECKESGFWFAALEAEAPAVLWEANLTGRMGLVIGGEGKGVRRLVRERCDLHLRIPISGPVTSLNASVSAGVALAECLRQRSQRRQ